MDTAQRGMGLDWEATKELIRRSAAEAKAVGGKLACGAGTDQLTGPATLDDVRRAYAEQLAFVEGEGSPVILMASRALAAAATSADDYKAIYGELLEQASTPVILHWLGDMFDPALAGYWGTTVLEDAADTVLEIIEAHPDKVDGIKVSLLEASYEVALRERLPEGVRMYTGDDFNYPELIASGSDALLGIFDAIAPVAAAALHALDDGDTRSLRRAARAHRPAQPPHLQGADAVLQDRRRLPRLPQRPPAALPDGRRAGEWPQRAPPRRAVRARRPGRPAAPTPSSRARGCGRCSRWRASRSSRLSFNSMTADRWPLEAVIDACAEYGIEWIGPWRHKLAELGVEEARRRIDAAGLKVSSLCRGGFFAAENADEDNRRAVEEAAALGTDALVLVCGPPATKDLRAGARDDRGAASRSCSRTRTSTASGSASSRCTR